MVKRRTPGPSAPERTLPHPLQTKRPPRPRGLAQRSRRRRPRRTPARDQYIVDYGDTSRSPRVACVILIFLCRISCGRCRRPRRHGRGADRQLAIDRRRPNNADQSMLADAAAGSTLSGRGIVAKTIAASTVREGPGTDFAQMRPCLPVRTSKCRDATATAPGSRFTTRRARSSKAGCRARRCV